MSFTVDKTKTTDGQQCKAGDKVSVHYVGTLLDGTVFDSSRAKGRPLQFTVGVGQVIRGWDEGITQLKVGETAILTCPPDYAYGSQAVGGVIPANSTLKFDVELMDIV